MSDSDEEALWRDPVAVASHWQDASRLDPSVLRFKVAGSWWDAVERAGVTLIVSREYEHLLLGITVTGGKPDVTYFRLPHPSGIAFNAKSSELWVASTRNPNQLVVFRAVSKMLNRADRKTVQVTRRPLLPVRTSFLPGCYYIHDLAFVDGTLHANSVGQNVVLRIEEGSAEPVWWPRSIESAGRPATDRNYIQLNSIAAGADVATSFFSASSAAPGRFRPGHLSYPVDRQGVIFSGATRDVSTTGLTRPHSARFFNGELWVDNSGYGEIGQAPHGPFEPVLRLPGWTRGLSFVADIGFVGTSRVIRRFQHYAPGLDIDRSVCGLHAVDMRTLRIVGSMTWPAGNQIFAIEAVPRSWTLGFPLRVGQARSVTDDEALFYAFSLEDDG